MGVAVTPKQTGTVWKKTESVKCIINNHASTATLKPPLHLDLTLKVPEELQLYGLYVYYVVHICDFGKLRVNMKITCTKRECVKLMWGLNHYTPNLQ